MTNEVSSINFVSLASELLKQDSDKVITKSELKSFVSSKETEFVSANINTDTAMSELKNILKSNFQDDNTDEAEENEQANESELSPVEQYNKLKNQIAQYEAQISEYNTEIENLSITQQELLDNLESEQKKYDTLEKTLQKENENYENIINKINSATENMEKDVKNQQKDAVYSAMSDYNADEDGDWEDFLADYTSDISIDSNLKSTISSLVSSSDFASMNLNALGSQLSKQAKSITNLGSEITTNAAELTNLSQMLDITTSSLTQAQNDLSNCILNMVSEAEMNLVSANNIDLTESLADGSPRYIFAKGKEDNEYHIYDMSCERGASLARQYGCDGGSLRGSDIVPVGNGYIYDFNLLDDDSENGEEIFYLTNCGQMESKRACYSTCSPLSFDLEGDGVNTSSKVINYDIDGDGQIDKINDSQDAVLVFDKDGDGISGEDGSECFGNNTDLDGDGKADGYKDGFEALKALAKKEGLIDGVSDNTLDEKDLAVLEKNYGLKIKTGGYTSDAQSLKDVGITEINLASTDETTMNDNFDNRGNQLMTQKGATFKVNGQTREYADIWHKKQDDNSISSNMQSLNNINDSNSSGKNNDFEKLLNSSSSLSFDFSDINEKVSINQQEAQDAVENSRKMMKKLFGRNIR